ncbi:odontogenesis associated phosphoprotein [Lycaon pictus]
MTYRLCFSYWLLVCWVLVTVAEGQREGTTPPGGSQDNGGATDCQVFTLTPPPPRRNPVTRIQLITRPLKYPFHSFPQQGPRVHIRFPNRPFLPQKYNHLFQFRPGFWPHDCFTPHYKYFPKRRLWRGSSSEESREKREVPNMLKPKKPMPQRRLLLSSSKLKCLNLKMKYLKLD